MVANAILAVPVHRLGGFTGFQPSTPGYDLTRRANNQDWKAVGNILQISKTMANICVDVALTAAKKGLERKSLKCPNCCRYILDEDHARDRFYHHRCVNCNHVHESREPYVANPLAALLPSVNTEGGYITFTFRFSDIKFYPTPRLPPTEPQNNTSRDAIFVREIPPT